MTPEQKAEGEAQVRAAEQLEGDFSLQVAAHKSSRGESMRSSWDQLRSVTPETFLCALLRLIATHDN